MCTHAGALRSKGTHQGHILKFFLKVFEKERLEKAIPPPWCQYTWWHTHSCVKHKEDLRGKRWHWPISLKQHVLTAVSTSSIVLSLLNTSSLSLSLTQAPPSDSTWHAPSSVTCQVSPSSCLPLSLLLPAPSHPVALGCCSLFFFSDSPWSVRYFAVLL